MKKEYKINIWRAGYIFIPILGIFLSGVGIYGMYCTLRSNAPFLLVAVGVGATLSILFFCALAFFYFNRLRISVDGDDITYRMPDKTVTFKVTDILKIEQDFSYAGVGYYVFFYDSKRKKRHIKFTQDLEDSEELIKYLQKRSGIKMRLEGTVDVASEKRPVIKVLKIMWNVFITVFLLGVFVVLPMLASSNRQREQTQHLPTRTFWP